jgi:septal ring factor EnvC (AmiA/AmiB activator)
MLALRSVTNLEMQRTTRYLCLFAAVSLALYADLHADTGEIPDSAQAKAKLAEVRGRIAALTNRLGGELKDRDTLAARLREADLGITATRQRLDNWHAAQAAAERRRGELRTEEARVQRLLDAERAGLASEVRAAYMIGQQEQIKLLLNQSDPARTGRMLAYYGYFARERAAQIEQIGERVGQVQELVAQIDQEDGKLRALQIDASREMTALQRAREERASALAAVTKQVSSSAGELSRLKREEQAEEALVADLARLLQDFPVDTQQSFDSLRGKLPWPVQGRVTAQYQGLRDAAVTAGVRRNGVLIETTRGAKVRAPFFGRVVYADWLQGLGLLLIIGHNGNYMTLYGHAEVLYKSVGDWVAPGDVIAALSDSATAPQLYFEIRDGRTPQDPKAWLKPVP